MIGETKKMSVFTNMIDSLKEKSKKFNSVSEFNAFDKSNNRYDVDAYLVAIKGTPYCTHTSQRNKNSETIEGILRDEQRKATHEDILFFNLTDYPTVLNTVDKYFKLINSCNESTIFYGIKPLRENAFHIISVESQGREFYEPSLSPTYNLVRKYNLLQFVKDEKSTFCLKVSNK